MTSWQFYNKTLGRVGSETYSMVDFDLKGQDHIKKYLIAMLPCYIGWKYEHFIMIIPNNKNIHNICWRNGVITHEKDVTNLSVTIGEVTYFIRVSSSGMEINVQPLPESNLSTVKGFHLMSDQDKLYIFHTVIVVNKWSRNDDIRAISSSSGIRTIYYNNDKIN